MDEVGARDLDDAAMKRIEAAEEVHLQGDSGSRLEKLGSFCAGRREWLLDPESLRAARHGLPNDLEVGLNRGADAHERGAVLRERGADLVVCRNAPALLEAASRLGLAIDAGDELRRVVRAVRAGMAERRLLFATSVVVRADGTAAHHDGGQLGHVVTCWLRCGISGCRSRNSIASSIEKVGFSGQRAS